MEVPAEEEQDEGGVGDTSWLLSIASPDEVALSRQTRAAGQDAAADAVRRCAAVIKDADAHVYRRGMAVLALGRTLARELGKPQSRQIVWMQDFRQVCEARRDVSDGCMSWQENRQWLRAVIAQALQNLLTCVPQA